MAPGGVEIDLPWGGVVEGSGKLQGLEHNTIHNIYPNKYVPIYMAVYYIEYIAYQIYSNRYKCGEQK
jgi:hypothetical protein